MMAFLQIHTHWGTHGQTFCSLQHSCLLLFLVFHAGSGSPFYNLFFFFFSFLFTLVSGFGCIFFPFLFTRFLSLGFFFFFFFFFFFYFPFTLGFWVSMLLHRLSLIMNTMSWKIQNLASYSKPTSYLHSKMQHDLHASEKFLTFNSTLTPSNTYQVKLTSIQLTSTFNLTSKSIIPLRKSKIQNPISIQITTDWKK